jgi:hypothetical protein
MIDDIVKSVKASLYDRTASPLFGAVALSWLAWNHRMFFVLFSGMKMADKFSYIDTILYGDLHTRIVLLAVGPLITAAVALFVYPYPARWVFRFWRNRQRELKQIRQQIEDATPLTVEESKQIRRQVIEIQLDYEKQLSQRAEEIGRLKQLMNDQKDAISSLQNQLDEARASAVSSAPSEIFPSDQIDRALRRVPYRLHHNPDKGRSKIMLFGPDGKILEGNNRNESSWRISDGRLELVQADGKVHSRFAFHPGSNVFTHTNDSDTLSVRGQYLTPEPQSAQQSAEPDRAKERAPG